MEIWAGSANDRISSVPERQSRAPSTLGALLADRRQWTAALACYQRALEINPAFAEAHHNRGATLALLGRHEEALASYDKALAARPGYAEALYHRGVALEIFGRKFRHVLRCNDFKNTRTASKLRQDGLGKRDDLVPVAGRVCEIEDARRRALRMRAE